MVGEGGLSENIGHRGWPTAKKFKKALVKTP